MCVKLIIIEHVTRLDCIQTVIQMKSNQHTQMSSSEKKKFSTSSIQIYQLQSATHYSIIRQAGAHRRALVQQKRTLTLYTLPSFPGSGKFLPYTRVMYLIH